VAAQHPHDDLALHALVNQVVTELNNQDNESLIILRNGGVEGWVRNRVLIAGEGHNHRGFAEAYHDGISRIDLLFRCSACQTPTISVEMKTNFASQPDEIDKRISNAIDQLNGFLDVGVPAYLVYFLTDLRGPADLPLVVAQNALTPWYKHFETVRNEWPHDPLGALPVDHFTGHAIVHSQGVCAEARAWTALVEQPGVDQRTLSFLNADGDPHPIDFQRVMLQPGDRPKRVRRWEWVPVH
jgi:hypothetical protein